MVRGTMRKNYMRRMRVAMTLCEIRRKKGCRKTAETVDPQSDEKKRAKGMTWLAPASSSVRTDVSLILVRSFAELFLRQN